MKRFYNNNDAYGEPGPFEAESREALADEMMPTFRKWALEAQTRGSESKLSSLIAEMRSEFITSLEEI
jgi:hypothetical protein